MKKQNIFLIALGILGVGYYIYLKSKKDKTNQLLDAKGSPAPLTPYTPLDQTSTSLINNSQQGDIFKVKFSLGKIPNTI